MVISNLRDLKPDDDAPIIEQLRTEARPGYSKRGIVSDPTFRRPFIAWDGEGINIHGDGKPQSYVLFGSNMGRLLDTRGLSSFNLLDHIVDTGVANPMARHIGFAFNYDSNMILRTLHTKTLEVIHKTGGAYVSKLDGTRYRVTFTPGKFFRVTRYHSDYDRETNSHAKDTVTIDDIFSFFAKSFIRAYEEMCGPVPEIIIEGKANRRSFKLDEIQKVSDYWTVEIGMLRELAEKLHTNLVDAGFNPPRLYGPGVLASESMKKNNIKQHMAVNTDEIREAARYAYAGGRFELFKVGRFTGPIYSIDINSAYPAAIAELPSLADGQWMHREFSGRPSRLARFGVYKVRLRVHAGFAKAPGPVFHRDMQHNISYPWVNEGWYWAPEVRELLKLGEECQVIEGWEYTGSQSLPFAYIPEMYQKRQEWKAAGNASQLALKLCMNSHYGKMAQRVGWDKETNRIPPWHQLEWAGWVTSYTRAKLYSIMMQIPWEHLIAVETDGIYTTMDPSLLGITSSKELGEWEVTEYDEILYIQSGLAWMRQGDTWSDKRRGLDADSFSLEAFQTYLRTLTADSWRPFVGQTTRFIGLGAALAGSAPTKVRHGLWETRDREITPGLQGKRIHIRSECEACRQGLSAYEKPHDLVIRSLAGFDGRMMSVPHDIPWEPIVGDPAWRRVMEEIGEVER